MTMMTLFKCVYKSGTNEEYRRTDGLGHKDYDYVQKKLALIRRLQGVYDKTRDQDNITVSHSVILSHIEIFLYKQWRPKNIVNMKSS